MNYVGNINQGYHLQSTRRSIYHVFTGLTADRTATLNTGTQLLTGQEFVIKNGDTTYDVILASTALIDGATTGTTPITLAAQNGHFDAIMLLLQYGADINQRDIHGKNMFMHAVAFGHMHA